MDGEYSDLIKRLKRLDGKKLDALIHRLHDEESEKIDCLQCANCCRTLGPRFIQNDIARMATHLKMKESAFIAQYLRIDEDGDYVFKEMPCPIIACCTIPVQRLVVNIRTPIQRISKAY